MDLLKQYLRQKLCLPPVTIIKKWSEYMDAESKLLSNHRAADTSFLAQHISAESRVVAEHTTAHSKLLADQVAAQTRILTEQANAHTKFVADQVAAQTRILTEQANAHAKFVAEQLSAQSRILAEQARMHAKFVADQASAHSKLVADHVSAQAKQRAEHVSIQARRITEPVDAHAALLDKYLNAREVLVARFTGYVHQRESEFSFLQVLSSVGSSVRRAFFAEEYLRIVIAIFVIMVSCVIGAYFGNRIYSRIYPLPQSARPTPQPTPAISRHASDLIDRIRGRRPTGHRLNISPPGRLTTHQKFGEEITTFFSPLTTPLGIRYASLLAPDPHDLAPAALSASTMLSSFASSPLGANGSITNEQKQQLNTALLALLSIRGAIRDRFGGRGMHVTSDELTVDAGCIICCAEVVETVLMPCRHMVVCARCFDQMVVRERHPGGGPVQCPVCRMVVERTIKVFRG